MDKWSKVTGNDNKAYSATADRAEEAEPEIDFDWAKIAKLSRERWSKEN